MIISRTPYRISFFGGGTDYPDWYLKNGGQVLSTTIDKYIYITCRYLPPFFPHNLRLVYSKIEACQSADELMHPSGREVMKYLGIDKGLEIHYDGDLPGRSGLGSSSAFTVGLLNALNAYQGKMISSHELGMKSIHIEQNIIKEVVGSQDQINAAYGGLNHIKFLKSGKINVNPITILSDRISMLENNLMLFYTGIMRTAEKVAKSYVEDIQKKSEQLLLMQDMVDDAIEILKKGELDEFGYLLNETWQKKRSLSRIVSNERVDKIYSMALSAGALGGKLSGAGGGGFLLFYVPIEKQSNVKNKLSKLLHVPFKFESSGSQIIFYDQDKEYKDENKNRPFINIKEL
ncbi:MAG: kinase [Candidatus Marinimicrobia bacterium]|nr:kinase [Candidatus Neomarinimicrobiota bacterium]